MAKIDLIRNISSRSGETPLSAGKLILDLLDIGDPLSFTLREFVLGGEAFGLEATAIRSALTRLSADGRLQRLDRGHYAIGVQGEPLKRRVQTWRDALARRQLWNNHWLMVIGSPEDKADRTVWRRTLRALALEGFTEAEGSVWVRPDNLLGGVEAMRSRLQALEAAHNLMIVQACGVDQPRAELFQNLWDGSALCKSHDAMADDLEISAARIDSLDLPAAAREVLLRGRIAIHEILHDPVLPEAICSSAGLSRLIEVTQSYQKIGKRVWHTYLGIAASR